MGTLINCLFCLFGLVVGVVSMGVVSYKIVMQKDISEDDVYPYDELDEIEIRTPTYEETEEFQDVWEEFYES